MNQSIDAQTRRNYKAALDVIAGKYGNNAERYQALSAAGYDYAAVQTLVNAIIYEGFTIPDEEAENLLTVEVDLSQYDGITLKFITGGT